DLAGFYFAITEIPLPFPKSFYELFLFLHPFLRSKISFFFIFSLVDPKDVLVSKWHFANNLRPKKLPPLSLEETFDLFCKRVSHYGSFWDHFEDVKEPLGCVKKVAKFLGVPFTPKEENKEIVEQMVKLCSFESISNQDVNKLDKKNQQSSISNSNFFGKECTITLEDVQLQLGLPVDGSALTGFVQSADWGAVCYDLFGAIPDNIYGGRIEMGWLRDTFPESGKNSTEVERIRYALAYILEMIGGYLMLNLS
ncbi:hypothetical protein J1N35_007102, partial [Gossypium stocksii]